MLIEDDGKGFIFACLVNYANYDLEAVKTMYGRQHVIPGLSDGGATSRSSRMRCFRLPVQLLGSRRADGRMALHELVRRQTREPARFAGLHVVAYSRRA